MREAWHVLEPVNPYVHGWHVDAIAEHLEAVSAGQITRLLINVPPGFSKSLMVSVFWPAWEWGPAGHPELRYVATSHSADFVKRDSRRMRDLVSSAWYRRLWGDRVQLTRWGEMSFANSATGFREGMPLTSLTGARADRVLVDDPHSVETAESAAERARTIRTFRESITTRVNDAQKSAIVVIMQRLHEADVSGVILAEKLGYEHLMLPMEFEPERRCVTSIGFVDPRQREGDLLFPERFPRDVVERDKATMGSYAVSGQFQQRPSPRGGGLFQVERIRLVEAWPHAAKLVRRWDFASSEPKLGTDPDWTAGALCGWHEGVFYVIDMKRARVTPGSVELLVKQTAAMDGFDVRVKIPQDPGAAGKAVVEHYTRTVLAGFTVSSAPETGSKVERATPLSAAIEAGNVCMVKGAWNEAFLDEARTFPAGAHDDQIDAVADAWLMLARPGALFYVGPS